LLKFNKKNIPINWDKITQKPIMVAKYHGFMASTFLAAPNHSYLSEKLEKR